MEWLAEPYWNRPLSSGAFGCTDDREGWPLVAFANRSLVGADVGVAAEGEANANGDGVEDRKASKSPR